MITENDIHMEAAAKEMYVLSADELIQQRCRARDDFRKMENSRNRIMKELTEALENKERALETQKQEIETQKQEIKEKDRALENKDREIELLKQQLAALSKNQ